MSASTATFAALRPSDAIRVDAPVAVLPSGRDHRLDYMRGIALLMIFVDHVQGNRFAALTLQAMGFADAAEVFVFIAGVAAVYAYRRTFRDAGWMAGAMAVAARIRTLYLAHLGMIGAVLGLVGLIILSGTGYDIVQKLGLGPLLEAPDKAILLIPVLGFLPHYMDILPLYVVLLASLPLVIAGFRLHPLLPLAIAAMVHACAGALQLNFPSFGSADGWFLNPFSWALVFTAGATTAELASRAPSRACLGSCSPRSRFLPPPTWCSHSWWLPHGACFRRWRPSWRCRSS